MLRDTQRLLRVTLPPGMALHLHTASPLPAVLADPTQVEQALLNLCTNAIHAIGNAAGSVEVNTQAAHPDARLCERLGLAPGHYVSISVSDSGPGMDAATLQRVFEPFFTTKPVGQGTGLGLAVVHGVMRTHQGAVDVQSKPGEGCCFTLYFPVAEPVLLRPAGAAPYTAPALPAPVLLIPALAAPELAPPAAHLASASGAAQTRRHVMYVDDDEALVFLVQRLLRRRGYDVSGFTDPHIAAAALRADPQRYDLLVTDYNMPGYCGVDLVRDALAIRADLPVALASGYITAEIEQAARKEGARALIHKPNDVEELCATVQRLIHGDSGPEHHGLH